MAGAVRDEVMDFDELAESLGSLEYRCLNCGELMEQIHDGPGIVIEANSEQRNVDMSVWACRRCDLDQSVVGSG